MNGDTIRDATGLKQVLRLLAAVVQKACIERRIFRERQGFDDETLDELLGDIKEPKFRAGLLDGVEECREIWGLWRQA